jgi:hypothetical protein
MASLIVISSTPVLHFLQQMNIHWPIIIVPNLQFTLGLTLWVGNSIGLSRCIMTYIHHYGIMQSSNALKTMFNFCFIPHHPAPGNPNPFTVFLVLYFLEYHVVGSYSTQPFQISFSHLVMCMYIFSMSFHGLRVSVFLVLNNI